MSYRITLNVFIRIIFTSESSIQHVKPTFKARKLMINTKYFCFESLLVALLVCQMVQTKCCDLKQLLV